MVEVGQVVAIDVLNDGNEELYFRTKEDIKRYGGTYRQFCRVKNTEEIGLSDFWGMSDEYFDKLMKNGQIRIVDKVKDI